MLLSWATTATAAGDDVRARVPVFDGTRGAYLAWVIAITGYIAWKLPDAVGIADGTEPRPDADAEAAEEPEAGEEEGEEEAAAGAGAVAEAAAAAVARWDKLNRQLYGMLLQALPDWLKTSVHLTSANSGVALLQHLRDQYGASNVNDRAEAVSRVQKSYVNSRSGIS